MTRTTRTRTLVSGAVCLAALGLPIVGQGKTPAQRQEDPKKSRVQQTAVDILAEVREKNSGGYAKPPTSFRQGHVMPRQLPAEAIQRTKQGFQIQLPSRAPVVTPVVCDGLVITSGGFRSKEIYAFDAKTGALAWALDLDDDGPSTAACQDGVCVFNTESCTTFALEVKTGKMLWSWWLGDPLMSAPAIANGRVFTSFPVGGQALQQTTPETATRRPAGMSHALAAFDLKTGKVLWSKWIDSDVMSAPVAVGGELYAATFAGTFYKLDQATGRFLSAERARATSAPVVVGSAVYFTKRTDDGKKGVAEGVAMQDRASTRTVYVAASKKAVYLDQAVQQASQFGNVGQMLDAANGFAGGAPAAAKPGLAAANVGQFSVSTLQAFQGSRILNYAGRNLNSMGDEVVCTDPETGKRRWTHKLAGDIEKAGGFLAAPPIAAASAVLVATLAGDVLEIDPESGKKLRSWNVGAAVRSQPVVHEGWIYVGTQDGKLVGIDTGDRTLTGWPQWGRNAARNGR